MTVTISSDPVGATLYSGDRNWGYTPFRLKWDLGKRFFKDGRCSTTEPIKVRWASGGEASLPALVLCAQQGKNQQFTFVRPDSPGREIDALFAIELARLTQSRQQANAAARQRAYLALAETYRRQTDRFCRSLV